jgi:hypothetical protein
MLRSISVSGRRSMMLPRLMGSERPSAGLDRGGGVLLRELCPDGCGGCRFECEEVEEPGE